MWQKCFKLNNENLNEGTIVETSFTEVDALNEMPTLKQRTLWSMRNKSSLPVSSLPWSFKMWTAVFFRSGTTANEGHGFYYQLLWGSFLAPLMCRMSQMVLSSHTWLAQGLLNHCPDKVLGIPEFPEATGILLPSGLFSTVTEFLCKSLPCSFLPQ